MPHYVYTRFVNYSCLLTKYHYLAAVQHIQCYFTDNIPNLYDDTNASVNTRRTEII